ncbi:MAG: flagellar export chaperone FliS [Limnochordales bacterium]
MSMDMNGTNALDGAAAMPGRGPARVQAGAGYGAAAYARQAAKQYRSTNVTTASPATLVLMMYDGALRFIRQGVEAIAQRDFEGANSSIGRAQDIVAELGGALDMSQGEIAENLARLYEYMLHRLVEGNVRKDPAPLQEVAGLLQELREAWEQVARGEGATRAVIEA